MSILRDNKLKFPIEFPFLENESDIRHGYKLTTPLRGDDVSFFELFPVVRHLRQVEYSAIILSGQLSNSPGYVIHLLIFTVSFAFDKLDIVNKDDIRLD